MFVHGCYWHHCPKCHPNLPKSNPDFWARKFELNRERDARKRRQLEAADWTVYEIWEHEIRDRLDGVVAEDLDVAGRANLARSSRLTRPIHRHRQQRHADARPRHQQPGRSDVADVRDDTEQQRRHQDGQPCREHETR